VASDQAFHRLLQRRYIELATQLQCSGNVVDGTAAIELIEKPESLLRERKGLRRAALDARDRCSPGAQSLLRRPQELDDLGLARGQLLA